MAFEHVPLWTFADAVHWVVDSTQGTADTDGLRKARRVVMDAYRDFPLRDDWAYFTRKGQFTTSASSTAGTLTYDHTGGTYEREVTLSGDTISTSVGQFFTVVIDDVHYPVESVKSTTVFTLREDSNPGADVAAGTSYTLYRDIYPVPIDYRSGSVPLEMQSSYSYPEYVSPAEFQSFIRWNNDPADYAQVYTIMGGREQYSGLVFRIGWPPKTAQTFDFVYQADPRPMGLITGTSLEYTTGTVSVSSTTVTGSGTAWTNRMIGCVIRFDDSTTAPTGRGGTYDSDNPYEEQRIVESVASGTSLTIDQTMTGTYSGVAHSIGDPLDLDYHVMIEPFKAMLRWYWHRDVGKSDVEIIQSAESEYLRQFARARQADYRGPLGAGDPGYVAWYAGAL